MTDTAALYDELRNWARGMHPTMAATELLIRGEFANPGSPWVQGDPGQRWIDFATIPDRIGGLSGGEQRFLRIAASLGGDYPIYLQEELSGLDREQAMLVLAACAHATGHQESGTVLQGNRFVRITPPALAPWPEEIPAERAAPVQHSSVNGSPQNLAADPSGPKLT